MRIQRSTLRDEARRILREMILEGELGPGSRINEVHLAEDLGISRSPLREALGRLEEEGFLRSEAGRGYFVQPLTREEVREVYPILAALESLAVRTSDETDARVESLERINAKLESALDDADRALELNDRWHRTLVEGCENRRLLEMLETLRRQVYRYENAFFRPGSERARRSPEYHGEIIDALKADDPVAASRAIERHWLQDLDYLVDLVPGSRDDEGEGD